METQNNPQQEKGTVAKIEEQIAKLPSDVFLWAALGAIGVLLTLKCLGKPHHSLFVGQWASPLLLLGI